MLNFQNLSTPPGQCLPTARLTGLQDDPRLKTRGIAAQFDQAQWSHKYRRYDGTIYDGWQGAVRDVDGNIRRNPNNGDPIEFWKNASKTGPHDLWANKPEGLKPLLLPHWSIKQAIRAVDGTLYGAEGVADTLTLWAAGRANAFGFFGTSFTPDTLAADLLSWGVSRLEYFCHPDAVQKVGQKIVNLLAGSGIEATIYLLPVDDQDRKTDLNDLWKLSGFDRDQFLARLATLQPLDLKPEPIKVYERRTVQPVTDASWNPRYVQAAIDNECSKVASAAANDANNQIYKSGAALGGLIGAGAVDEDSVFDALMNAARMRGKSEREARASIRSGIKDGKAEPRQPKEQSARAEYSPVTWATAVGTKPLTSWPNGVPTKTRAAMNEYIYPAIAPVVDMWFTAQRTGLVGDREPLTPADLLELGETTGRHVSKDTIKNAMKQGADYFGVVCPPVLLTNRDNLEEEEKYPGQTTPKAAGRQTQPHKQATGRYLADPATICASILKEARQRIVEKHFPHTEDDPTVARLCDLFAGSPDLAGLEAKYGSLVDGQPELKFKLNAARREYERLLADLSDTSSAPIPVGWTYRNAAEYAACCARAVVVAAGGATQYGKPAWSALIGKSERRIKSILKGAGVDDLPDQIEEKPIVSAADLPQKMTWFHKTLNAYQGAERVAKFYDLEDRQSAAMFIEKQKAQGRVIKLEKQVANKQVIASDVQPERKPRQPRITQPENVSKNSDRAELHQLVELQSAGAIVPKSKPIHRAFYGAGPDPAWRDRGIMRLLDLAGLPSTFIEPSTGEIIAYTPVQALDLLLGRPMADPLLDPSFLAEIGATASIEYHDESGAA